EGGTLKRSLETGRDLVMRNIGIVKLDKEIKCPFNWNQLALKQPDSSRLLPFFEGLELESLAQELRAPSLFQ
ncbi:MAG: hypothetical protein JXN60_08385, partial [Lentisphaerae bacterium]|nr:hypothetical protein [Lentisphaerota bacterium]